MYMVFYMHNFTITFSVIINCFSENNKNQSGKLIQNPLIYPIQIYLKTMEKQNLYNYAERKLREREEYCIICCIFFVYYFILQYIDRTYIYFLSYATYFIVKSQEKKKDIKKRRERQEMLIKELDTKYNLNLNYHCEVYL